MLTSILDYLDIAVALWPNKPAFIDSKEKITFFELQRKAKTIGSNLQNLIPPRQPVVVITGKSVPDIAEFMGVAYAGCYYVPIDSSLPSNRIKLILDSVKPKIILSTYENVQSLSSIEFSGDIVYFDEMNQGLIDETSLDNIRRWICDVDPLYAVFTSGSTGVAKGVLTSHRSVIDYIDSFCEVVKFDEHDILGGQASLDYVAAIRDIYVPLKTGASTILLDKKLFTNPQKLFSVLNSYKITALCWASTALSIPVKLNVFSNINLDFVNKVIFTGSVFPSSDLAVWQSYLPNAFFMNQYGPTEITASCTYHVVDHRVTLGEVLPIGIPYRNTRILLLSEDGQYIRDPGEKGEICVAGSCLALGYINNFELTKRVFVENPANKEYPQTIYRTGDIGSYDEKGLLWFHGRKDSQIKHMGYRIELSDVEHTANAIDGVDVSACMYDIENAQIYFFYEGKATIKEIASKFRESLPSYMVPRKFVTLEVFPRTQNGKVDFNKLREYFNEQ